MRLVAYTFILLAPYFQQVMASYASSNQQRGMNEATFLSNSVSSSICWKTMADKEKYFPAIFKYIIMPDWLLLLTVIGILILYADSYTAVLKALLQALLACLHIS